MANNDYLDTLWVTDEEVIFTTDVHCLWDCSLPTFWPLYYLSMF